MRQLLYFILLFCFVHTNAQEGTAFLDSLNLALKKSKKKEEKFKLLMEISDYWSYRDTSKAFSAIREAEKYSTNEYSEGIKYFYEAGIYFDKAIEKSENLYLKAEPLIATRKTPEAYEYLARLWHNYGTLQQIKGDTKQFMDITMDKCIPYAQKSRNKILLASNYTDVGIVFFNIKEYDKAINYYQKAMALLNKNKDNSFREKEMSTWVYINLAETYLTLKKNIDAYKQILLAEKILSKIPQSQYNVLLYKIKSQYHTKNNNLSESLKNIEKGIDFAKKMGLDYDEQTLTYEKYKIYKEQNQLNQAKNVLLNLLNNHSQKKNFKNHLVYLNEIAEIEHRLDQNREAYTHLKEFQQLYDSMITEEEKMKIISLESAFKNKEQQSEIHYLTSKNQQQKKVFWTGLALVISIALFTTYTFYQRKKHNEQKLQFLEQTKEMEMEQALREGENKERERLSKDLHDGIGGQLVGIKIGLEQLAREQHDNRLLRTVAQLEETLMELRGISRNLMPTVLLKYGLNEAIKDFCQNSKNEQCQIITYLKNLNAIESKTMQIHIYRILQEAVTNAMKHSEATKILVQCTYEAPFFLMEIEDNGQGFDPDTAHRNLGLNNIEKRVSAMNGHLSIDSVAQKGTTLTVECNL